MDDILSKRKEIFFNNLVSLGLDKVHFEKKYGIPFHKDMFVLPNKKGYEVVMHFLFSKLNAATGKEYNVPWPLLHREQDRAFQKTCYGHFMIFSQENVVKFPRIVPSLMSTFGGDRFYDVCLAFSCYVMSKTISKNENINLLSRPTVTQENFSSMKDFLQCSTILHLQKFKDTESFTHINHRIWTTFTKNLEECLQKLKLLLKRNEELLKKNRKILLSLYSTDPEENFNLKKMIEKSIEFTKPIIKQKKNFEKFFSSEKMFWKDLESEIGENNEKEILNGQDFNISVIENLPEKYLEKLKEVGICSKEDGKLSTVRYIKIFMAHLAYLIDLVKKDNLNQLHQTYFVEDLSLIERNLSSITNVNKKICEEIIPELEDNITKLELECFEDLKDHIQPSNPICNFLPIIIFNSEAVRERTSYFSSDLQKMFQIPHAENEPEFYSLENNDSVFEPERMSTAKISSDCTRFLPNTLVGSSKEEEIAELPLSDINKVHFKDSPAISTKLSVADLDDIDFATYRSPFKMRGSWLTEESLHAMTLSDKSLDE